MKCLGFRDIYHTKSLFMPWNRELTVACSTQSRPSCRLPGSGPPAVHAGEAKIVRRRSTDQQSN